METIIKIFKNEYFDSVTLMSLSAKLSKNKDIKQVVVLMATEMNKELMIRTGFDKETINSVSDNDLVVGVMASNIEICKDIIEEAIDELRNGKKQHGGKEEIKYSSIHAAINNGVQANIAVISVPGEYAAREARIALENNLNVMLFSDNVSIENERKLKEYASKKGLFLMGPDCGTSIINNVGLCFANAVPSGNIGLIAASGTGLQEVTVIISRLGGGISQAIGVGGRDLNETVGGIMMLDGIKALENDENTKVIVLISKPPAEIVKDKILKEVQKINTPVVICFIDSKETSDNDKLVFSENLADAAYKAVAISKGENCKTLNIDMGKYNEIIEKENKKLNANQKYIRGLFCGGTLCSESLSIIRKSMGEIYSNISKNDEEKMKDVFISKANTMLDLGDDVFTKGKPHPMIEPTIRLDRIVQEAKDENTAVILLDFELGYGCHDDPVGVTIDSIKEAQNIAQNDGRYISFVGYVCGTNLDKQKLSYQEKLLKDAGVNVAYSNAEATMLAVEILKGGQK